MNSYEITIINMENDTDMNTIQTALADANISDAGDEEVGMYLQYERPRSVFVDPSEVVSAVAIINALGFATDEDAAI